MAGIDGSNGYDGGHFPHFFHELFLRAARYSSTATLKIHPMHARKYALSATSAATLTIELPDMGAFPNQLGLVFEVMNTGTSGAGDTTILVVDRHGRSYTSIPVQSHAWISCILEQDEGASAPGVDIFAVHVRAMGPQATTTQS